MTKTVDNTVADRFFIKTRSVAKMSTFHRYPIGCVAVYKGNIIATGYNKEKTHPMQAYYNRYRNFNKPNDGTLLPKVHAEIDCLTELKKMDINFSKVKLFIYRTKISKDYGLARPCPACMEAIKNLGIKDIYYTTEYGYAHERIL